MNSDHVGLLLVYLAYLAMVLLLMVLLVQHFVSTSHLALYGLVS
jgi:hypothetical protein